MMTGTLALLPDDAIVAGKAPLHRRALWAGKPLAGLLFTKDPPPPRV